MKVDGGCHCGFITFEAEVDPEHVWLCHCTDCQTFTGSAFRVNTRAPAESFRILSGEPTIYVKTAESGAFRKQSFCPRCGTPIYSTSPEDKPKSYGLRVGTIRQRDQLVPKRQLWTRSEQHWLGDIDAMARIEKQP